MKALEQGLLDLLSKRNVTFFVPTYQGTYEWEIEECEAFFNDIVETAISKRDGHFFGTLLYYQTETVFGQPEKLILVDGQQRLVTTMLFMTALRDVVDDVEQEEFINDTYIVNAKGKDDTAYKMKLGETVADWMTFVNVILKEVPTTDNRKNRVFKNYQYFIRELTNLKNTGQVKLTDLISKGLDQFKLVVIELEPEKNKWENPKTVFNSLNSVTRPLMKTYIPHFETDHSADIKPVAKPLEPVVEPKIELPQNEAVKPEEIVIPTTPVLPDLPELADLPVIPVLPELEFEPELAPAFEEIPPAPTFHSEVIPPVPTVEPEVIPLAPELPTRPITPTLPKTESVLPTPRFTDLDTLYENAESFANGEVDGDGRPTRLKGTWRLKVIDILIVLAILVIIGILITHVSYIFDFQISLPFL